MSKLIKIYKKNEEVIKYLIFGVLTTIISLSVYFICVHTFLDAKIGWQLQLANFISWIVAIIFAYITNRIFVFKSKSKGYFKEMMSFLIARIITLLMDMGIMFLFVTVLKQDDTIIKIISQAVVIISNYIFSKLFVFNINK